MGVENTLYADSKGHPSHGECLLNACSAAADYDARKDLNTLFVTFANLGVDAYTVPHLKVAAVCFDLFFCYFFNDWMHDLLEIFDINQACVA